jgi:hypothetical protein
MLRPKLNSTSSQKKSKTKRRLFKRRKHNDARQKNPRSKFRRSFKESLMMQTRQNKPFTNRIRSILLIWLAIVPRHLKSSKLCLTSKSEPLKKIVQRVHKNLSISGLLLRLRLNKKLNANRRWWTSTRNS